MSSLSPNQNVEEGKNWQEEEEKHNCDCSSMGLSSPPTPVDYWHPDFLLTISMSFLALTGLMLTPPQPVFSPSLPNPRAFCEPLSAWCPSINSQMANLPILTGHLGFGWICSPTRQPCCLSPEEKEEQEKSIVLRPLTNGNSFMIRKQPPLHTHTHTMCWTSFPTRNR